MGENVNNINPSKVVAERLRLYLVWNEKSVGDQKKTSIDFLHHF